MDNIDKAFEKWRKSNIHLELVEWGGKKIVTYTVKSVKKSYTAGYKQALEEIKKQIFDEDLDIIRLAAYINTELKKARE